jgi:hypothetical protein
VSTVTLQEARKRLEELVKNLPTEGEIIITDGREPVALLRASPVFSTGTGSHSVLDIKPVSVGGLLKPYPHPDDDSLGEMLEGKLENRHPK